MIKENLGEQDIAHMIIIIVLILITQVNTMSIWMDEVAPPGIKAMLLIFILQRGYGGIHKNSKISR